jgi:dienelactone hydrolase
MKRSRAVLAAASLLTVSVAASAAETIKVASKTGGKPVTVTAEVFPPKAASRPAPAMIIMHGSGGVHAQREYAYAHRFNELGVAAIVIDSFKPRGVRTTVEDQAAVRETDMLADAIAVLRVLRSRPDIDPARIGLIGFSKGGTVVLKAALRRNMKDTGDGKFALLFALYPWCGDLPMDFRPTDAPLTMLLGSNDTYVGTASCREYAKKFEAAGGKLTLKVYEGGRHGWDVTGATSWQNPRALNSSKCVYDEVQPGKWIERSTKLVIYENGRPTPSIKKAHAVCKTLGTSGGYDAAIAKQSWQEISNTVRAAFRLE